MKYIIKYAVQPIYRNNAKEGSPTWFIVSKCFVVRKLVHYYPDGQERDEFDVVFPFRDRSQIQMITPTFNCVNQQLNIYECINASRPIRNMAFDTYEEACALRDLCNQDLDDKENKELLDYEQIILRKEEDLVITEENNNELVRRYVKK